jgi:hypothetical protein
VASAEPTFQNHEAEGDTEALLIVLALCFFSFLKLLALRLGRAHQLTPRQRINTRLLRFFHKRHQEQMMAELILVAVCLFAH